MVFHAFDPLHKNKQIHTVHINRKCNILRKSYSEQLVTIFCSHVNNGMFLHFSLSNTVFMYTCIHVVRLWSLATKSTKKPHSKYHEVIYIKIKLEYADQTVQIHANQH